MDVAEVGYILLGWLLAVVSPLITRGGERARRTKEIGEGLRAEIGGLGVRLAGTVYLVTTRFGTYDRAFLTWIRPFYAEYQGTNRADKIATTLANTLTHTNDEIAQLAAHLKAGDERPFSLKKYRLPYLEANLGNLDLFPQRAKLLALETAAQLELINEEIDRFRFFHELTFDSSVSPENHDLAKAMVKQSTLHVEAMARETLDRLPELQALLAGERYELKAAIASDQAS